MTRETDEMIDKARRIVQTFTFFYIWGSVIFTSFSLYAHFA